MVFSVTTFMLAFIVLEGTYGAPIDSTTPSTTPTTQGATTNDPGAPSNANVLAPVNVLINACDNVGNNIDPAILIILGCPQQ